MTFSKHPIFAGAMIALSVGIAAEGCFVYVEREAARKARRQLEAKRREWQAIVNAQPAPTDDVAAALEADLARTTRAVAAMRASLTGNGPATLGLANAMVPKATADAFFDIAALVERMRGKAEAAGVAVRPGEHFGFAEFANAGPEPGRIAAIFRERQLVEFLVDALLAAHPRQLVAVARERPADANEAHDPAGRAVDLNANGSAAEDLFEIDPRISARAPGYVRTTAFRLTFTGQTVVLRTLLNKLAEFELPLVVRAVEVGPEPVDDQGRDDETRAGAVPLVPRSLSRFTVTVEYVDLAPSRES